MTTVAVLGTGIMGAPMARNLAVAGFDVRAWNRTPDKAQAIEGVEAVRTPYDAMTGADVVLTMLADADAVEETVCADDALRRAAPAVWVQSATVGVAGTERLRKLADDAGVTYVDAPVLGTRAPAEKGQLTVLASGPDGVREQLRPVFDAIGAKTVWLGAAGESTRLKLVVNSWLIALNSAVAEGLSLARALGLDPQQFLDTIAGGPLDVGYAHLKGAMMLRGEFPTSFPVWGAAKDAGLVLDAAASAGLDLKVAAAARQELQAAADAGHADDDMAAVIRGVG
jgi:3-hydroxyisobutyrate dehydrogenase